MGLNVPWVACGHDFGPPPPAWSGAARTDFGALERDLVAWRADGIRVVRFWLLGGGVNYPVGRRPQDVGWRVRGAHYEGAPVALGARFLEDVRSLQTACANAGVRLVPSLLSFEALFPREVPGSVSRGGLRRVLLEDPARAHDALLAPLLEVLDPAHVRAVELMNEPDWVVRGGPVHAHRRGGRWRLTTDRVPRAHLEDWLREGIARVAAAGHVPTVGFARADAQKFWSSALCQSLRQVGLWQVHHYPGWRGRPLPSATPGAVVGEFASAPPGWHPAARPWRLPRESEPTRYLRARLEHVRARGYAGAWLWSARARDPASAWGPQQRVQVRDFTRS